MRKNRILGILLAIVMLLSVFPVGKLAFAADEQSFDVNGSKKADPTELDSANRETTVTLSLPSAEYQNEIDIVFVTDSSTSTDLGSQFIQSATELFESIVKNNPKVTLKIGVVLFTGSANDAIEYVSEGAHSKLTVYNEETKDLFSKVFKLSEDMTKDAFRNQFGRGSGPHVGLDMANMWLEEDSEVDDSHKYVVLFTDGKGYMWANEDHESMTIYSQYYTSNKYQLASSGKPSLSQVMGYNKMSYSVDVLDKTGKSNIVWFPTYEDLYNSTNPELTGVTEYDQHCFYAYGDTWEAGQPDGTVVKHETTNGEALFGQGGSEYGYHDHYRYWFEFTPNETWAGIKYMEANPFEVIKNEDGTYTFDTENVNPDYYQYHVDNLQKGIYKAGHLWTEMGEKYNQAVITYDSSTGGGLELVGPFKAWLRANSDYSASKDDATQVQELFKGIDNSIRYMVSTGVVTDKITDDFTLKNADNENAFRMTLTGEALDVTYEDGKWYFGESVEGKYPYEVSYDESKKTITWTINVPIENVNPIALSYDLIIDEDAESGFYDTNVSAVLDYKSTDGKRDGSYTFEVPKVSYIKLIDIPVSKTWEDADDQDGKRPGSISVNLMDGNEKAASATISERTQWTFTFEGMPDSKIVDGKMQSITYSLTEDAVENYSAGITATVAGGFTITNTHAPEKIDIAVTKTWEDSDDQDGIRPESVKVQLYAGEEAVGDPAELTEAEKWTYTWTGLDKYAAGEEIVYSVKEVGETEGYEAGSAGSAAKGFTNTNTHSPEKIDIAVTKVWEDSDDQDGIRPESVKVQLYAGEEAVGDPAELTEAEKWAYTWTGLDKYAAGEEIVYSVKEVGETEGYETETSGTAAEGFVITNTHEAEKTDITVEKVWVDNDDERGLRPESVTINLLANGEKVDSKSVTKADGWKYTFPGLPKYEDGKEIEYTVTEEAVEGYETTVDGLTVTNKVNAPKEYTITYKLNGGEFGGKTDDILEVYPGGTVISIHEAPTREGYTFLRWEGSSYQPGDKYTVTEDHTFTAQWEADPEIPDTGDNSLILQWTSLLVISAFSLIGVLLMDRKRRAAK